MPSATTTIAIDDCDPVVLLCVCMHIGVNNVTLEDFVSVWKLHFTTVEGNSAVVVLPYIVERDERGDRFFFNPVQLCRHILLRPVCFPPPTQYSDRSDLLLIRLHIAFVPRRRRHGLKNSGVFTFVDCSDGGERWEENCMFH